MLSSAYPHLPKNPFLDTPLKERSVEKMNEYSYKSNIHRIDWLPNLTVQIEQCSAKYSIFLLK